MDWYRFTKKYIWDDHKTPYFTAVAQLTREQAHKEVFAFAVLLMLFFATLALAAGSGLRQSFNLSAVTMGGYALSVIAAAALIIRHKHRFAARYCLSAPLVLACGVVFDLFHPALTWPDKVFLLALLALALRYTLRVIAICNAYPHLAPTLQPKP